MFRKRIMKRAGQAIFALEILLFNTSAFIFKYFLLKSFRICQTPIVFKDKSQLQCQEKCY